MGDNKRCDICPLSSVLIWVLNLILNNRHGQADEGRDYAQRPDDEGHRHVIRVDYSVEYYDGNYQANNHAAKVLSRERLEKVSTSTGLVPHVVSDVVGYGGRNPWGLFW